MTNTLTTARKNGQMTTNKFFGVTRFSIFLPGSGAWEATRDDSLQDPDALHKYLYSDARMTPRLRIFKDYAVPIYARYAAKYDFQHIVQYSEEMPGKWKNELKALAARYSFIVLNSDKEYALSPRSLMEKILRERAADSSLVAWFRIDDDDLLSTDFVDRLNAHTTPGNQGKGVSFGFGYLGLYQAEGGFSDFRELHRTMLAQGQAFIGAYDAGAGILSFPKSGNHRTSDRLAPFIVDSRHPVFIWTHHDGQDTRLNDTADGQAKSHLAKFKPASNMDEVRKLFPTLA